MDVVTSSGSRLSQYPKLEHHELMLDATLAISGALSVLDASVDIAGSALAKVISGNTDAISGEFPCHARFVPLAFSPCGA